MGIQLGTTYTLTGPDGTIAVFNNSADANFVGFLTDIGGMDSPDVRESGDVKVDGDGGFNGNNYFGRRPIVLEGIIPATSTILRNQRIEKLQRAANALRADATLSWTEDDTIPRRLLLRRQTGLRIPAQGATKTFSVGLVSANHLIESAAENFVTDVVPTLSINLNNGPSNAEAMPRVVVRNVANAAVPAPAATTSPLNITRYGAAELVVALNYSIPVGGSVTIDFAARTVVDGVGTNLYQYIDPINTTWRGVDPVNPIQFRSNKGTEMDVYWRYSWA